MNSREISLDDLRAAIVDLLQNKNHEDGVGSSSPLLLILTPILQAVIEKGLEAFRQYLNNLLKVPK